jgi:hypothetical protein
MRESCQKKEKPEVGKEMGLEHTEGELFEGAAARLGVQQVDDGELKEDPAAVDGQEPPLDCVEGDGVDVGGEEAGELAEDLLDTDATAAVGVGPQLDEVGWMLLGEGLENEGQEVAYCR